MMIAIRLSGFAGGPREYRLRAGSAANRFEPRRADTRPFREAFGAFQVRAHGSEILQEYESK
jgi:hypothetical protein